MADAAKHAGPDPANAAAEHNLKALEGGQAGSSALKPGFNDPDSQYDSFSVRIWKHLDTEVDSNACTLQLNAFCLMTGWTDAISFAAAFIFSGFQTGNTVQLAAAIARLFSGPDRSSYFHPADRLALCSLISFVLGAAIGQIGDRIGAKKRLWLISSTLLQSGMLMAAFIAIKVSDEPSYASARTDIAWTSTLGFVALAFMSAAMGLQGIVAKRLNTHYGTTVVLTTIWCELIADPGLLHIFKRVPSRDHRILAIVLLFIGAFVGRIVVGTIGSSGALGIAAAIKLAIALTFWLVPSKPTAKKA